MQKNSYSDKADPLGTPAVTCYVVDTVTITWIQRLERKCCDSDNGNELKKILQ